jgi:hypothetical protein
MDEAERRFQEYLDRFSRELGDLVMSHVDEQVQAALAEAASAEPEQLELRLEDLRPEKKMPSVPRVDPNSMLGTELSQIASLEATLDSLPESATKPPEPPPAPSRPLFVHRRARDGRIHELSRVGESLPASG